MLICPTASSTALKGDAPHCHFELRLKGSIYGTWGEPHRGPGGPPAVPTGPVVGALRHQLAESCSAAPSWPASHIVGGPKWATCAEGDFDLSFGARLLPGVHLNV